MQLVPQGIIPRDPNLTFRMTRLPRAIAAPAAAPAITIGAGADMFADATEITYQEFRDVIAAYTYNKGYSAEADEPETVVGTPPQKTAWWKIKVPADKQAWLTADLQLSFGAAGFPDTQLAVFSVSEGGTFADLFRRASNEDVNADYFYSRVENVHLVGSLSGDPDGTTYYIQVGDFANGVPGICYVLRVSLTETEPGAIPAGGVDPDA